MHWSASKMASQLLRRAATAQRATFEPGKATTASGGQGSTGPSSLAEVALRLSRMPSPPEGAWEAFETRAVDACSALRSDEIVPLLHACTIARRSPRRLLARLAKEIPEKLPQFDPGGLCICLHSYAQLRVREAGLFTATTRWLLRSDGQVEIQPHHLTSLLYSHARVLLADRGLVRTAQRTVMERNIELSVEDLATTLKAFASLRTNDMPTLAACVSTAVRHVEEGPLPALCDVLATLVRLSVPCGALQRGLVQRCVEQSSSLKALTAADLVQLLHGLGGVEDAAKLCGVAAELLISGGLLKGLAGPRSLVQAVKALARSRDLQPGLLEVLQAQLIAHMVDFGAKDVATVAVACQRLKIRDGGVLEALCRQGLRQGFRFKTHHAKAVLDACAAANFEHGVVGDVRDQVKESAMKAAGAGDERWTKAVGEDDAELLLEEPIFHHQGSGVARPMSPGAEKGAEPPPHTVEQKKALNDPELRKLLRKVDRQVLRPAGLRSEVFGAASDGQPRRAVARPFRFSPVRRR